jgi:hypothetical protein
MRLTKRWMLAGLVALGMGWVACEQRNTGAPAPPPGTDTEEGSRMGEVQKLESERRELYEDVAEDVGVEPWPDEQQEQRPDNPPALGGGGAAGSDEPRR